MVVGSALGAFAVARPSSPLFLLRGQTAFKFRPLSSSSFGAAPSRKLVLYSKPGCCLCDGLKEKLQAAFLLLGTDSLHGVDLQATLFLSRTLDITTNPEWENAYQYEIPVLAKVLSDGTEWRILALIWVELENSRWGFLRDLRHWERNTYSTDYKTSTTSSTNSSIPETVSATIISDSLSTSTTLHGLSKFNIVFTIQLLDQKLNLADGENMPDFCILQEPHSHDKVNIGGKIIPERRQGNMIRDNSSQNRDDVLRLLSQVALPRLSPRLGVELLQKKIAAALSQQ
ncbi:hypothetical protein D0Y65_010773 [Glycine soja]|uniref:Glutaredoxin-like protein n=1 Tax=Glycine soja TaxID=3848 RepID=A0A445L5B9_GLYSO|nr:hypothetical protein D0Y65_010773 [Glycine soja]